MWESNDKDLTLTTPHGVFNHRVGCFCLNSDSILLQYSERGDFWFTVGGRIEFGEDSATALKRELKEELNVDVDDFHLAALVENFFKIEDQTCHEVAPYYRVKLPDNFRPPTHDADGDEIILKWHKLKDLDKVDILPAFIKSFGPKLLTGFHHVTVK